MKWLKETFWDVPEFRVLGIISIVLFTVVIAACTVFGFFTSSFAENVLAGFLAGSIELFLVGIIASLLIRRFQNRRWNLAWRHFYSQALLFADSTMFELL